MSPFDPLQISILSSVLPYLNPGTGGLIIQLILGALFAIGLTVRVFWSRIKKIVIFNKSKPADSEPDHRDETR